MGLTERQSSDKGNCQHQRRPTSEQLIPILKLMLHWDRQEHNRLILFSSILFYGQFLAGVENAFISSNRVVLSYSSQAGILPQDNTLSYVVKDSKKSFKREWQLTASLRILKVQMERKGSLAMFGGEQAEVFFTLLGLGFFVSYPKKLLFMHLPEESWDGKNQRAAGIRIQKKDRENRHLRSSPSQHISTPILLSFQTGNTSIFLSHTYKKKKKIWYISIQVDKEVFLQKWEN